MEGRALVSRGPRQRSDAEIAAYAATHDFVVLTHDLDFGAILAATHGNKPSVVQLRTDDLSPNSIGARLIAALRHVEQELELGALLTVGSRQIRVRMLPLGLRE